MTTKSSRLTPEHEKLIRGLPQCLKCGCLDIYEDLLAEIDALRAENELVRDKLLVMAQEHAVWEKHSLCEVVKERDRLREALDDIARGNVVVNNGNAMVAIVEFARKALAQAASSLEDK